jgi:hypothetical protein
VVVVADDGGNVHAYVGSMLSSRGDDGPMSCISLF